MFFQQILVGEMKNFSYLVGCRKRKECAAIDCGFDAKKIQQEAIKVGYRITKILLTHVHYDHSGCTEELSLLTGAPIYMNRKSEKKRGKIAEKGMWYVPKDVNFLSEGQSIEIGDIQGKILSAPGHQSDHFLYIFGKYLFTGDTLFIGGIGRTDLPDSDPREMKKTLSKIMCLSDEYVVCPGHDYGEVKTRTLGEEKQKNMYLQNTE
jgi:glyoxylase-like metal-dependent hydrolase (beta-lactamase superfamily II)